MSDQHFAYVLPPASVVVQEAWQGSPSFSVETLPAHLRGDLSRLNEPGYTQPMPMKEMTREELRLSELEDRRVQLRSWIESAKRSVDPGAGNKEHEKEVAEYVRYLEAELA